MKTHYDARPQRSPRTARWLVAVAAGLESRPHPIVGDKLYGHDEDCYLALVEDRLTDEQRAKLMLPFHALHAGSVRFELTGEVFRFSAEPDERFKSFLHA